MLCLNNSKYCVLLNPSPSLFCLLVVVDLNSGATSMALTVYVLMSCWLSLPLNIADTRALSLP